MKPSPLQLKGIAYPVISVRATPDKEGESGKPLPIAIEATVLFDADGEHFSLIDISQQSDAFAYVFEIRAFSTFVMDVDVCRETYANGYQPSNIAVNVARLLYSASREMLALVTSRAPYGTACLPSVVIEAKDVHVRFMAADRDGILRRFFGYSDEKIAALAMKKSSKVAQETAGKLAPKKQAIKAIKKALTKS